MQIVPFIAQQGQGFNFGGLLQILVLLLAFGGPLLGWIVKKVKEQAELKAARDRQRNMERESLRSTEVVQRESPSSERIQAQERQREMRDLAMRRQAQLQELRQRQMEVARQRQSRDAQRPSDDDDIAALTGIPGTASPQARRTPSQTPNVPGGGVPSGGQGPVPLAPGTRRVPAQGLRTPPVVAPTQRRRPQDTPKQPSAKVAPQCAQAEARSRTEVPKVAPLPGAPKVKKGLGVRSMLFDDHNTPRSKDDLRRAYALQEIFAKPVSMRKEIGGIGEG